MNDRFLKAFKEALEITGSVNLDDQFRDYKEWDSLSHMSLIAMLDSEFHMQIENAVFEKMKTVGDIFKYVETHSSKP